SVYTVFFTLSLHDALPISFQSFWILWDDIEFRLYYFFRPFPPRPLKVSSATPDLSSSPRPIFTIFEYCLNVAAASGRSSFFSFRSEEHTSELQSRFDLVCR